MDGQKKRGRQFEDSLRVIRTTNYYNLLGFLELETEGLSCSSLLEEVRIFAFFFIIAKKNVHAVGNIGKLNFEFDV